MHLRGHRSINQHLWYTKVFFFRLCVNTNNWDMFRQNLSNFRFWSHVKIWNDIDLHKPILVTHGRDEQFNTIFTEIGAFLQFLTYVELSRLMTAILEIPQYVAHQKNGVYALLTLFTKSQTFYKYRTIMPLSCA